MIDLAKNYSIMARRAKKSVIRELLKLTSKPEIISFAGGLPDPAEFPTAQIEECIHEVLAESGSKALQYGSTEGEAALKKELIKIVAKNGMEINEDNILITVASQQALDLIGRIFIDPSDPIILELPSYLGGIQAFRSYGANFIGVPMDEDGVDVDKLADTLERLKEDDEHYKFLYLVPDFQNPSGVTLSAERRHRILELAEQYKFLIIEDSPYRELRFEGEHLPMLGSLDKSGNVISLFTFSKTFVPGIRLGWVVAHPRIIQKLAVAKQSVDLCTPPLSQYIAAKFCEKGYLEPHIQKVVNVYRDKKNAMIAAFEKYMPKVPGLSWTNPQGGLFLFLTLPEDISADDMFYTALENNVAYVIGSAFFCDNGGQNTMRLNFSYPTIDQIDEGVKRLAETIEKFIAKRK
ncbi:MAG: aminotransferase [Candidatus Wallbacteria bacterium HGW-Wallbacteria-1]|jgi:2-aminoadipate transaminase|uniref:Aminotransferase n=1 Tax=Candidatus Wallbacteria bacterium HGW-Wallbacteria-1 TaxID=2013854 RepID=A0A2N1PLQ5_9BACT|nr:MAG: aminotransferase [Candidatus Wallbacteria bacterium HGW-Wallbacteria-1]